MKICLDLKALNDRLEEKRGAKIAFTNGVFDILHPGHVQLFKFAKNRADILVVGINEDDSVRRLKGSSRPIFPLEERMEVLAAIEDIDFIIPFAEDTPLRLIQGLHRVDILIKGGDYPPTEVVGRREVEAAGGELLIFATVPEFSTTSIINKIRRINR